VLCRSKVDKVSRNPDLSKIIHRSFADPSIFRYAQVLGYVHCATAESSGCSERTDE